MNAMAGTDAANPAARDFTACGACRANEHGRCQGGHCTCRLERCTQLRARQDARATNVTCPDCGAVFGGKGALTAHRNDVHALKTRPPEEAQMQTMKPPPEVESNGAGSYPCPDCDKTFDKLQPLGSHRARAHGYRVNGTTQARAGAPHSTPRPPAPRDTSRGQTARRAAERTAVAADQAAPFDMLVVLPLQAMLASPGVQVELGTIELRALTTDDGRMRVVARFVPDEA